jgi:hypothetical protein
MGYFFRRLIGGMLANRQAADLRKAPIDELLYNVSNCAINPFMFMARM